MPNYPVICPLCQHSEDVYAKMSERAALKCSACGHDRVETRFADLTLRSHNREFAMDKRESVLHFVPEADVDFFRKAYRTNAIQDDGTVIFNNRAEEREFVRSKQAWERDQTNIAQDEQAKPSEMIAPDPKRPLGKRRKSQQPA